MPVRLATPADVPTVLPMVLAQYALHVEWDAAKFGTKEGFDAGFGRWMTGLATNPRGVFVVATDDSDKPVGFLVATIEKELPIYSLTEYGFIHDVWIEAAHRRKGLARVLVQACISRFHELGVKQIRCETAHANEDARKVFATLGFRPTTVVLLKEL